MKERIIKYLGCPECNSDLELKQKNPSDSMGHIIDGSLICKGCQNSYPIINGVPFFRKELSDVTVDKNRKNFADEWNYFTAEMNSENEKLAKNELDSYFQPFVNYTDLTDKMVLDGGCGGGRFLYIAGKESNAKEIFGIDLSSAVFTAFKNTKHLHNVTVIQADITKLPFKKQRIFDFVYSVGVLHHLPSPIKGFTSLAEHLKPNGKILAWVYGKEGNFLYITFADPIRKAITSKLPFKLNLYLSCLVTMPVWAIIWTLYFPINFMLGEKISRKILPMNEYFTFFRKRVFRDFWRTVFDKMVPTISYYISKEEFENWFESNNLKYQTLFRNGHSWLGIGENIIKNVENKKMIEQLASKS